MSIQKLLTFLSSFEAKSQVFVLKRRHWLWQRTPKFNKDTNVIFDNFYSEIRLSHYIINTYTNFMK